MYINCSFHVFSRLTTRNPGVTFKRKERGKAEVAQDEKIYPTSVFESNVPVFFVDVFLTGSNLQQTDAILLFRVAWPQTADFSGRVV
jgi:hypothetical protein